MKERMIAWNLTGNNLSVVLDGKPYTIPRTSEQFDAVMTAISDENFENLERLLDVKETISRESEGRIAFDGYNLSFNGETFHNAINDRLAYLWKNNYPYKSLLRFMDNLMDNQSYRAVEELYGFLEATDLPITNDGHFLAYKKIREDFTDIYTQKIDNSVGAVVKVRRNQVDEDSTRTCSYGLHVCSRGYLPHFGCGAGSRVVLVKVHPANVVAVPADYNNAKMRVCEYEVVDDITDQFRDSGILSDSFYTEDHGEDFDDDPFDDDLFDDLFGDDLLDDPFYDDLFDDLEDEDHPDDQPVDHLPDPVQRADAGKPVHATSCVLNVHQVREIKSLLAQGELTLTQIAQLYGVNESTIRKIKKGETWAWVV